MTTEEFKRSKHSYYNALVAASYLGVSSVKPCDKLIDSGRCTFDGCGNVTAIDGLTVKSRSGSVFTFRD